MDKNKKEQDLIKEITSCQKCCLHEQRRQVVVGQGLLSAKVMLIGEAPGKEEDESGLPFQGRSGRLLRTLLEEAGFNCEQDIYICNTVKCRPPANRKPKQRELDACTSFLEAQINLVNPELILLCGATAVQLFFSKKTAISKLRGQLDNKRVSFRKKSLTLMPLFHPAYLLRNPSKEEGKPLSLMRHDLKKAKHYLFQKLNK